MRKFTLFAGLLYALLATLSSPANADNSDKIAQAKHAVVMVRGYNQVGGLAYGSGVVVAQDKIISNCHVFRTTKSPWVNMGEETYPIISVKADRYHDLCLLTTFNLPIKPAMLGSAKNLKRGQEIVSIGHSNGAPSALTSSGSIKTTYAFDDGFVIRSTAPFRMGASGSGLFNMNGELLGINTFKSPGRVAYFYSLPIEWLANLEKQPEELVFPVLGKTFWEEDDNAKPFFMQIAEPEINQDWPKLTQVAEKWIEKEPKSTEAWFELGTAKEHLNKMDDAQKAYQQAVALDANNIDALLQLGFIAKMNNDSAGIKKMEEAIARIDPELAVRYREMLSCKTNC